MGAYVRRVKTASGATAVQVVWSRCGGHAQVEHIGSAHDEAELVGLRQAAQALLHEGQPTLELGLAVPASAAAAFRIVRSRSARLVAVVETAWTARGFDRAVSDRALRLQVVARVVESTSKLDSL